MGRTHLRALVGSPTVAVTAVAEPVEAARSEIAAHGLAGFADVDELLDAGKIDGVLIAAPTDRHLDVIAQVLAADLPILCEKPCGSSSAALSATAAAIRDRGVPFQVAYWRRYVPALQGLRRRIQEGDLGAIHLYASSQWDGLPPGAAFRARSGGIFRDMGVHEFDQVRWLSDQEFNEIEAVPGPPSPDPDAAGDSDSAQAIARLSGGASAFVSLGRYYPVGDMARIEVFGTRDAVRLDFLDPKDGDRAQLDALVRQAEGFATYARGGPQTGASIDDAVAALRAAEHAAAAIESARATAGAAR